MFLFVICHINHSNTGVGSNIKNHIISVDNYRKAQTRSQDWLTRQPIRTITSRPQSRFFKFMVGWPNFTRILRPTVKRQNWNLRLKKISTASTWVGSVNDNNDTVFALTSLNFSCKSKLNPFVLSVPKSGTVDFSSILSFVYYTDKHILWLYSRVIRWPVNELN